MRLLQVVIDERKYFLVSSRKTAQKYFGNGFRQSGYVNIYPDSCCSSLYHDANRRNYYRRIKSGLYTQE